MHVIGQRKTSKLHRFLSVAVTSAQNIAQKWKRWYISWGDEERERGFLRVGVSEIVGFAIEQFSLTLRVRERRT
jgi:hypothetical protein